MCGINGFNWKDKRLLLSMNKAIVHRGPDNEGDYSSEDVSLGHLRLSIIDLTRDGHQPMFYDNDNLSIVFNGEIYNYLEIRKELEGVGYKFNSKSDTEVILASYKEWGKDCLKKFNGMWAFCLYDKNEEILFLSRDRFGIKPLYYYFKQDKFIFSSEIKAILKHDIEIKENDSAIFNYLYNSRVDYSDETFFMDIVKLPAASYGIFELKKKEFNIKKYWKLELYKKSHNKSYEDQVEEMKKNLRDSVNLRLRSDVEVGSCLSGGMDSSSIVCLMDDILKKNEYKNRLRTFSAVFPGKNVDESEFIDIVDKHCETTTKHTISPDYNNLISELDNIVYQQGEPFVSTSIFIQWKVMELINKNNVKVVLDGQGADEELAGYDNYFSEYIRTLLINFKLKRFFKESYSFYKKRKNLSFFHIMIFSFLPNFVRSSIRKRFLVSWMNNEFLNKHLRNDTKIRRYRDFNKYLKDEMRRNLASLLKYEDLNSMYYSIESRLPFLDYRLVEFLFSVETSSKIKNGENKCILRDAMKDLVPDEIVSRKEKIGFEAPERDWFSKKDVLKYFESIIQSESFKNRKYWNYNSLVSEYNRKVKNPSLDKRDVWRWINLELWLRKYIDKN